MALKFRSIKKYNRRLILLMMAVIIPGLVISGLGIIYVSQQQKARELRLQEKFETILAQILDETESQIETSIVKTFGKISRSDRKLFINNNDPDSLQNFLKNILLENPVVKYPFLINAKGTYIFPFTKRVWHPQSKMPSYRLTGLRTAENLEFKERRFSEAIRYYLEALEKTRNIKVKPYLYYSIARCYYKLKKFPQAADYLNDIRKKFPDIVEEDKALYFRVLHQAARAYKQMNLWEHTIELYLQLYEKILQYELSENRDTFSYFKNEALDYLNRNIRWSDGGSQRFNRVRALEGLENLSELDIALRWKYFDLESDYPDDVIERDTEKGDAFRFDKIQEFYLPTDEKTIFYKEIKNLKLWTGSDVLDTGIKKITGLSLEERPDIVYNRIESHDPTSSGLFFGFMVSFDFIQDRVLPGVVEKKQVDEALRVFIEDKNKSLKSPGFRFPLKRLPFKKFLPTRDLVLTANRENYIETIVKKEMWLNYGMIVVIISMLILGTWFFYKYITRETELMQLKSAFVDSASHTLKTPLTRIRMMAEKMDLGWLKDEGKKKEYLQTIITETDRMSEMITNMLDFSKVESGKKHYELQKTSITDHVHTIIALLSSHIKNRGFQLKVEIERDIPQFYFDPDALKLILVNLIQNALKYSEEKKYIGIKLYKGRHNAVIEVEDRGIGIAENEKGKIFEKFYRVSNERVKAVEGSGLGLFLVSHAVNAHKGLLKVESEPGIGTTFIVCLPLKQ